MPREPPVMRATFPAKGVMDPSSRSEAAQVIAEGLARAREGQFLPGEGGRREDPRLQRLIPRAELPPQNLGEVDHHHDRVPGIGVDVYQVPDCHLQARLLQRLPDRGGRHFLPPVHIAARDDPFPVGRLDRPADQDNPPVQGADGARRQLGVQEENEPAPRTDGALRLPGLQAPGEQRRPAAGTEPELGRVRHGLGGAYLVEGGYRRSFSASATMCSADSPYLRYSPAGSPDSAKSRTPIRRTGPTPAWAATSATALPRPPWMPWSSTVTIPRVRRAESRITSSSSGLMVWMLTTRAITPRVESASAAFSASPTTPPLATKVTSPPSRRITPRP